MTGPVKDQDRLQDEMEATCEGMVTASKEFTKCGGLHKAAVRLTLTIRLPNCDGGKSAIAERLMKQYVLKHEEVVLEERQR